jgi:hypothetical protein
MIRHVVMWKLKDEALGLKKEALILEMKSRLEALVGVVPQIKYFQMGINEVAAATASDLVLVSDFDNLQGLQGYLEHPAHQKVVEFVSQVVAERRVVDFEAD